MTVIEAVGEISDAGCALTIDRPKLMPEDEKWLNVFGKLVI